MFWTLSCGFAFFFSRNASLVLYPSVAWIKRTILKLNYFKHSRPVITAITGINKRTEAQSEISHAIITTLSSPPTHRNKAQHMPVKAHTHRGCSQISRLKPSSTHRWCSSHACSWIRDPTGWVRTPGTWWWSGARGWVRHRWAQCWARPSPRSGPPAPETTRGRACRTRTLVWIWPCPKEGRWGPAGPQSEGTVCSPSHLWTWIGKKKKKERRRWKWVRGAGKAANHLSKSSSDNNINQFTATHPRK